MDLVTDTDRIDTLLALALISSQGESKGQLWGGTGEGKDPNEAERRALLSAPSPLSELKRADMQIAASRAAWYAKLAPEEQSSWLRRTLSRAHNQARDAVDRLDEHVHSSHIVEVLRREPPQVQRLVLHYLPRPLAARSAATLNITLVLDEQQLSGGKRLDGATPWRDEQVLSADIDPLPAPKIVAVIRRTFLAHFIAADALRSPTELDLLSGAELARLVRLLGAREIAVACRGITAVEAVASFLSRFSTEDAQVIAAHIAAMTTIDPPRIAFAEHLVHIALSVEQEPGVMLNRVGMALVAMAMVKRNSVERRYTEQKLPVEAAEGLRLLVDEWTAQSDREMVGRAAKETERLATDLRRASSSREMPQTTA